MPTRRKEIRKVFLTQCGGQRGEQERTIWVLKKANKRGTQGLTSRGHGGRGKARAL